MTLRVVTVWTLLLVAVGAVTALSFTMASQAPPDATTPTPTATPTVQPSSPVPLASGGGTPQPYQYDAANNRHWDPGHGHWHPGPPPQGAAGTPNVGTVLGGTRTPASPQPGTGSSPLTITPMNSPPSGVSPGGQTPKPYQYDAANNRHWDPGHNHWHPGPPPANQEAGSGTGSTTGGSGQPNP